MINTIKKYHSCFIGLVILLGGLLPNTLSATPADTGKTGNPEVSAMIERLLPGKSTQFILQSMPVESSRDSFLIESAGDKILIKGTNPLSMAKGFNYYLKNYCHTSVSWYA